MTRHPLDRLNEEEREEVLAIIKRFGLHEATRKLGLYRYYTLAKAAHGVDVSRQTATVIRSRLEVIRLESRLAS